MASEERKLFTLGRSLVLSVPKEFCSQHHLTAKSPVLVIFGLNGEQTEETHEEPTAPVIKPEVHEEPNEPTESKLDIEALVARKLKENP